MYDVNQDSITHGAHKLLHEHRHNYIHWSRTQYHKPCCHCAQSVSFPNHNFRYELGTQVYSGWRGLYSGVGLYSGWAYTQDGLILRSGLILKSELIFIVGLYLISLLYNVHCMLWYTQKQCYHTLSAREP